MQVRDRAGTASTGNGGGGRGDVKRWESRNGVVGRLRGVDVETCVGGFLDDGERDERITLTVM